MTRSSLQAHPLRNVSDTAHWVAIYRAMESERPDALFNDPLARRLGGERGEAIVKALPRGPAMGCAKWWLFDLASPRLLKYTRKRWEQILLAGHAPFLFAPPEGTDFFLPHGWREAEFHSTWDTSWRLHRTMSGAWLWNLLSRLQSPARREVTRRMSGCAMLENAVDSFPTASRVTP